MRIITLIIIHCSAVGPDQTSSAAEIDQWHRQRGWKGIGYHYVIRRDGTIEPGRPEAQVGAHCKNHNAHSIGVCYEGGLAPSPQGSLSPSLQESLSPSLQGSLSPSSQGRISPSSQENISPSPQGRISPSPQGRISPSSQGSLSPSSQGILVPADTRTPWQKAALLRLLSDLMQRYPNALIVGHHDLDPRKSCPCFDAAHEYRAL